MKLISPDSLNPGQRAVLEGYSRFFPPGSVCVNVMLGAEPWDIRPLLLSLGKVNLVRFSAPLGDNLAKSLAADLESISELSGGLQRVQLLPGEGRFMVIRPYFPETLKEALETGSFSSQISTDEVVTALIRRVLDLVNTGAAHGHISPSNIIVRPDGVVLVDHFLGALQNSSDIYLAPESSRGRSPGVAADIFGLGRTLKTLVREGLSESASACLEAMLKDDPRERPTIFEVAQAFGVIEFSGARKEVQSESNNPNKRSQTGKVVRHSGASIREMAKREGAKRTSAEQIALKEDQERDLRISGAKNNSLLGPLSLLFVLVIGGVWFIKDRYPALYFELASRVPLLAPQHSAEYETEWASRNKAEMAAVGRAAVIRREPAAVNTIINDLISGSNPELVNGALLRVAFLDAWRSDLTPADQHAALVYALEALVPEGRSQIQGLAGLHPGVLFAMLGHIAPKALSNEIKQMPAELLVKLPEPFGPVFAQAKAMGASKLGDPLVSGLAAIVTGNSTADAFQRFLGNESDSAKLLAKVTLVVPAVSVSNSASAELISALAERGGDLSTIIGWFDLVDLAGWSKVNSSEKLSLILGILPDTALSSARLADLLTFPLEGVRQQAVVKLKDGLKGEDPERLLVTLATPAISLTREQTISLVSALKLPEESRIPFIAAWFNLNPAPDAVLLILLSRSNSDASDVFNLEAARYLRKSTWAAGLDVLKLLSRHPEPLARVLAYGRLDPSLDEQRSVLLERQRVEKDPSCLKILKERLSTK